MFTYILSDKRAVSSLGRFMQDFGRGVRQLHHHDPSNTTKLFHNLHMSLAIRYNTQFVFTTRYISGRAR